MRCIHCDREIPDDAVFCPYCGLDAESEHSLDELKDQLLRQLSKEVTGDLPDIPSWERERRREYRRERQGKQSKKHIGIIVAVLVIMAFLMVGIWIIFTTMDANERRLKEEKEQALKEQQEEELNKKDSSEDTENQKDGMAGDEEEAKMLIVGAPEDFDDYYKLSVKEASASSVISQEGTDNSAVKAVDGNEKTSWQEGVNGDGLGESLHLELEKTYNIKYMSFQLGNWNSAEYYDGNNRPKELEITVGDLTQTITFPDGKTQYWVEFSREYPASDIDMVIRDVYKGSQWDDTCIAEIGVYGRGN